MRACDYSCYRLTYITSVHERVSTCGGMDSEPTGRHHDEERTYLVVAPDMNLAIADFKRYHSKDDLRTTELVGTLEGLVTCL